MAPRPPFPRRTPSFWLGADFEAHRRIEYESRVVLSELVQESPFCFEPATGIVAMVIASRDIDLKSTMSNLR
jgi:hypothetical protein